MMGKQQKWLLLCLCLVGLLIIGSLIALAVYDNMDHAGVENREEISAAVTLAGRKSKQVRENQVLLVESVSKEAGGNTIIHLKLYALPDGLTDNQALKLSPQDAASQGLTYMGTATATLNGDDLEQITNLDVRYIM